MANHKSALKRDRQNKVRRSRNIAYKSKAKNIVKEVRLAISNNNPEQARLSLDNATSILHKIQSKGIIHKNTASRKISRLSLQVNKMMSTGFQDNKEEVLNSPR